MSISIDIAIESDDWTGFGLKAICNDAVMNVCSVLAYEKNNELSLAFVSDSRIQDLNRDYRGKDKPTNVLSFPMSDFGEGMMLGDIVLAYETIAHEAKEQGKAFEHHLTHLIIHGFLHLFGYDHMDDKSAAEMEAIEIKALAQLGIDNPYELKQF